MKYVLIMLLAFLCAACGTREIAIEDEFTEDEVFMIQSVINEWVVSTDSEDAAIETSTGWVDKDGEFTEDDWLDESGVLFKILTTEPGYKYITVETGSDFLGVSYEADDNIAVVADSIGDDKKLLRRVLLHEFGHLYGLDHYRGGVMALDVGLGTNCISYIDLDMFCDINDCGPNRQPSCEP